MDYINPFSGMSGDQTIESPFLRSMDRQNRQNLAMPFIDMAQQNQQMDIQKKQMENQEWSSPLAQQLRKQTMQTGLVDQQQKERSSPFKTDADISDFQQKIDTNPSITKKMIAESEAAAIKARGGPMERLVDDVAQANKYISQFPESSRRIAAKKVTDQWAALHPGAQLPDFMKEYDPVTWDLMSLTSATMAKHRNAMEFEGMKEAAAQKRVETQGTNSEAVARIQADSRIDAAQIRGSGAGGDKPPKTIQEAFVRAQPILNNPNASYADRLQAAQAMESWIKKQAADLVPAEMMDVLQKKKTYDSLYKGLAETYGVAQILSGQPAATPTSAPKQISVGGVSYDVISQNPDGTVTAEDPKTGKTVTLGKKK